MAETIEPEKLPAKATVTAMSTTELSKNNTIHDSNDEEDENERERLFSPLALTVISTTANTDEDEEGAALAPLPVYKAAGTTEIDFDGLLNGEGGPLRLREDLTEGCGGQLWPAGMTLARYMLRYQRDSMKGKRILELGAGGGLVGLAVARGCELATGPDGAHPPLYITDQAEMFSLMKHNIALNGLEGRVEALLLNWGEPLPAAIIANPPDVVLAADCVYFEPAFPLLLSTLSDLLSLQTKSTTGEGEEEEGRKGAVVYFCFKKRRRADMQFLRVARRRFCVTPLTAEDDDEQPVWSRQGLFMFAITAKEGGGKGKV